MPDPDETDLLAAEYVLGTLDADERADVAARLDADAELSRAVRAWEDRFAPLADAVPAVTPPAAVYDGIRVRLFGIQAAPSPAGSVAALRRRLRRWQAATGGLALLAASLLAWVAVRDGAPRTERPRLTAILQRDAGAPAMLLDVDLATRRLTIRPMASAVPEGHAYELWIIDPTLGAPRSLGVVPTRSTLEDSLTSYDPAVITGATYAVTIEAVGGSPTGRPTAAPVLTGKLAAFPS